MTTQRSALLLVQRTRRRSLSAALARQGVAVVAEAEAPEAALPLVAQRRPTLIVVELRAEGSEPELMLENEKVLDFVAAARELVPGLHVVALTDSLEPALVARAISRGVDTCITSPEN